MKEFKDIVASKTTEMIEDGTIEEMIFTSLRKTVNECVNSALKSYSDFGKAIKEKIEESIQSAKHDIQIPAYNKFIAQSVNDCFVKILHEDAVKHLNDCLSDIIKPIKKQAKFSELLGMVEELWADIAREEGLEKIEIDCRENDDNTALYVTFTHPEYDFYSVKATFYNFKSDNEDLWHIGYINESGKQVTGRVEKIASVCGNSVTDLLFKYYAMRTKFELDCDIESIYVDY